MSIIRLWIVTGIVCVSAAAFASPNGKVGVSGKNDSGICLECHSGGKTPHVELSGPLELALGERGTYTFTMHGGPGVIGGYDIAVEGAGAQLVAKDEGTRREAGELTHKRPATFADGALIVTFEVVAPSEGEALTLFAAGNSCNGDEEKTGDGASATSMTVMLTGQSTGGGGGGGGGGGTGGGGTGNPAMRTQGCSMSRGQPAPWSLLALFALLLLARARRALLWACLFIVGGAAGCNQEPLANIAPIPAASNVCTGNKQWNVRVTGKTLERFEGKRVWVSAVEPRQDATEEVAVFLEGRITNGAVALTCDRGLTDNYWYPSFSVAIDADDDGRCSSGNLHMTDQLYGWGGDQVYSITGAGAGEGSRGEVMWQPVVPAHPVWHGAQYCTYYFPML